MSYQVGWDRGPLLGSGELGTHMALKGMWPWPPLASLASRRGRVWVPALLPCTLFQLLSPVLGHQPLPLSHSPIPPICRRQTLNSGPLPPRRGFCMIWEGQSMPFVNRAEITWWVFLAGTGERDASPRCGAATTEPWKCVSNYRMNVASWTQIFHRILVKGC